jgi:dTMP kinase
VPLIVVEGIDGCGKTTQAERIEQRLRANGRTVLRLREPGGTPLGEAVRGILLDPATQAGPVAELFGYQMARAQLCDSVIRPALAAGTTVLLDRFWYSTIAYQAFGLGLPAAGVRAVIDVAVGDVRADIALWFAVDPLLAARRRAAARGTEDRIEARGLAYLERVHAGYAALYAAGEMVRIDASQDADTVSLAVVAALSGVL